MKKIRVEVQAGDQPFAIGMCEHVVRVDLGGGRKEKISLYRTASKDDQLKMIELGRQLLSLEESPEHKVWAERIKYLELWRHEFVRPKVEGGKKTEKKTGVARSLVLALRDPRASPAIMNDIGNGLTRDQVVKLLVSVAEKKTLTQLEAMTQATASRALTEVPDNAYMDELQSRLYPVLRDVPEAYWGWRSKMLDLHDSWQFREAHQAMQKATKVKDQKTFPRLFALEVRDVLHFYLHRPAAKLIHAELKQQGYCLGDLNCAFYRWFHSPLECLGGLIPAAHPLWDIYSCWPEFLASAIRRFELRDEDPTPVKRQVAFDFYARLAAAVEAYTDHVNDVRKQDRKKKEDEKHQSIAAKAREEFRIDEENRLGRHRRH